MSQSQQLEIINEYITLILNQWEMADLTHQDFLDVWLNKHPMEPEPEPESEEIKTVEVKEDKLPTISVLRSMKKEQLQELCLKRGLSSKGVKNVLINRVLGREEKPTKKKTKNNVPNVLDKLLKNQKQLDLRRNIHGRYEHIETQFVFDETTEKVIGKQLEDGTVAPLKVEDIDICKQYHFSYEVPENLNV